MIKSSSKTQSRSKSPISAQSRTKSPPSSPSKSPKKIKSPTKVKSLKTKKGEKRDMSKEEQLVINEQSRAGVINNEIMENMSKSKKIGTEEQYCRCCNSSSCVERMRMLLDRDLEQRQLQVSCLSRMVCIF